MEYMTLGRTTLRVPRMGIGAMTWGEAGALNPARFGFGFSAGRDEEERAVAVLEAAGANLIDTAAQYGMGASEKRLGELTRGHDIVIATKFPMNFLRGAGRLPKDLEGSLSRLGRDTVDLYQVHYPSPWMSIPRAMALMADAVEAGRVRAVGVSNFNAEQTRLAHELLAKRGIALASNQVQYSLLHRKPEVDGVFDACRELGVTLIAYMPLASGALTGKYSADVRPTGIRRRMDAFRPKNLEKVREVLGLLSRIGEPHGKSTGQVALRWLIERGALPIPGAKNAEQATHNVGALDFSLTASEMDGIDQATVAWKIS
jgi:aryl-alcohol dehydrogenase-like predicted oxidoreductase